MAPVRGWRGAERIRIVRLHLSLDPAKQFIRNKRPPRRSLSSRPVDIAQLVKYATRTHLTDNFTLATVDDAICALIGTKRASPNDVIAFMASTRAISLAAFRVRLAAL